METSIHEGEQFSTLQQNLACSTQVVGISIAVWSRYIVHSDQNSRHIAQCKANLSFLTALL